MAYLSTVLANSSSRTASFPGSSLELPVLARAFDWLRQASARRSTISALSDLSDRQLRDIGVERADVPSFVDDHLASLRRY